MSGTISTSWWHPSDSAQTATASGIDRRRILPPSGIRAVGRDPVISAADNKPPVRVSMGRGGLGVLFLTGGEPLGDLGLLEQHLRIDLPAAVLAHERIELVLGEAERVDELVLRLED